MVCFSSIKEPHFFSRFDFCHLGHDELRELVAREYLQRYFGHCWSDNEVIAEGSVSYLYVPEQMRPVLRLWPEAQFIIALRDPLTMLPSLHKRLLFQGDETVSDFEQAWAMCSRRARGQSIPRSCADARWLRYDEAGQLGKYVEHFLSVVGPQRCHFVLFDDLQSSASREYRRILSFLGLPDDNRTEFKHARSSSGYKFGWLQRLLKRPPMVTRRVVGGRAFREHLKPIEQANTTSALSSALNAGRKRLLKWNTMPARHARLEPEIEEELRQLLSADVDRLAQLIGRDLSHWLGRNATESEVEPLNSSVRMVPEAEVPT